jgi:alginate O-acetyltransferase complex protein AlgI
MLFNSIEFLAFFPIVTILFFLLPHRFRWFHLLVASCIFYMAAVPIYILILFFLIIIDYVAGIMIENSTGKRRKWFLVMSIVANISVLCFFKYCNFFLANYGDLVRVLHLPLPGWHLLNIVLPIGLSFHTFQAMSYTIEVYRGNQKAERHFGIYALYVMFYPQLVTGPIERPQNMLHQFHERHWFDYANASNGLKLMLWGMFKKVVIADRLVLLTDPVFLHPGHFHPLTLLVSSFFFLFRVYCDFSGYSDIALGTAMVIGFKLMVNFNRPFVSKSLAEFWTRWHISLSSWFRDYLYISLGGNRVSIPRWYFNIFFVFVISGLWHGANWTFLVWGGLHGFYLVAELMTAPLRTRIFAATGLDKLPRLKHGLGVVTTFTLVMISMPFFGGPDIKRALYMFSHFIFAFTDLRHPVQTFAALWQEIDRTITIKEFITGLALILFLEIIEAVQSKEGLAATISSKPPLVRWSFYFIVAFSIIHLGVFENRQFIYFQF